LFIGLLVWIKTICTKRDAPNVAYACGQTKGFDFYAPSLSANLTGVPLLQCLQPPDTCVEPGYYRGELTELDPRLPPFYMEYGYTPSGKGYPFYALTVGDDSQLYEQVNSLLALQNISALANNPSPTLDEVTQAYFRSKAVLVVCPATASSPSLVAATQSLYTHLLATLTWVGPHEEAIVLLPSQAALEANVTAQGYEDSVKVAAAIVVNEVDPRGPRWAYSVRVNFTQTFETVQETVGCLHAKCAFQYTVPTTQFLVNPFVKPAKAEFLFGYTYTAFSTLQKAVDDFILNEASRRGPIETTISLGLFPEPAFHSDDFLTVIAASLALFFVLAFLYPVSRFLRALVLEKETKIKETMKIMGLSAWAANLSWVLTMVAQSTVTVSLMTLLGARTAFSYSNSFLIFLFLLVFSLALVMFVFLVSTFFSKAKTAATAGTVIFFASFFPYYALTGPGVAGIRTKAAACLLAPTCLGLGADVLAAFEGGLMGLQWDNIFLQPAETNFSYAAAVGMLLLDAVLYGLLAAYLEAVLPSEFGTQLPFYFPFLPSYWRGRMDEEPRGRHRGRRIFGGMLDSNAPSERGEPLLTLTEDDFLSRGGMGDEQEGIDEENAPLVEAVEPALRGQAAEGRSLEIQSLRKVFATTSGNRVAVDRLDMAIYEGQITVLLGHNGAGKSTTISMLTGLVPPTAGDARVRGLSLNHDMARIRQNMGICPQHDTLWPELTVAEHLEVYGVLKGVRPGRTLKDAVERMIQEVGLQDKAQVESSQLSGGMKRKLSLGMALIGDSKVVLLDEPTSGVDTFSRRQIWGVLERNKRGRVMLLSTHFMDEADMLGDRIAVMADGRLKALGSSLFLKSRYGVGYTLVIVKKEHATPSAPIVEAVRGAVPAAEVISDAGAELAFRLPFSASPVFPGLFRDIDARKDHGELQISTYGISVTTLFEVFLRIGEDRVSTRSKPCAPVASSYLPVHGLDSAEGSASDTGNSPAIATKVDNRNVSFERHVKALLAKRYIYAARDRKSQCCLLVLPAILILFGLSLIKLLGNPLIQDSLVLSPNMLNADLVPEARNPFPVLAHSPASRAIMSEFDYDRGLYASYIDVASDSSDDAVDEDPFYTCAVGAKDVLRMSRYLANTAIARTTGPASRYGALTFANSTDPTHYTYNILLNASALHGAGVYMNLASNAILRNLVGSPATTADDQPLIIIRNHPLPLTHEEQRASFLIEANTASTFVLIGLSFISASIAIFIVKEAESKAKHQQIISGISLLAYWLANFAWDVLSWLPSLGITLALMYAFGVKSYTTGQAGGAFVLLFIAFAPAATAFTYVWTFCFSSHSAAQTVVLFINFLTGLVLSIVSFVLSLIDSTRAINLKLRYVFRLFPPFCFGDGLLQLALCVDDVCPKITAAGISITEPLTPLHWDVTLANIIFMLVEALLYFLITLIIEHARAQPWIAALAAWRPKSWVLGRKTKLGPTRRHTRKSTGKGAQGVATDVEGGEEDDYDDEDVKAEAERVLCGESRRVNDVIRLEALRKVFQTARGPKVAVRGLSFGIPKGETFGFLGINGAGKTTTLSMLSGEFPPTSGAAYVAGYSITTEQPKLRKNIGFCPQFSALIDVLTTREHLTLFARIKGLPEPSIPALAVAKMKEMDLLDFADKAAGSLSGGNQRKVSMAIATIGDPSVIFADEPSTGMDPASRRKVWDVLSAIRSKQSSIVLTTHSMEEAEALCTRIAIMVAGKLRCLGTPQHLKSKFGEGFELEVKVRASTPAELAGVVQDRLGSRRSFTLPDVKDACRAWGRPDWATLVCETGSGATIWAIVRDGAEVPALTLAEWLLAEESAERLCKFLKEQFGRGVRLIERASWLTSRFSLPARASSSEEGGGGRGCTGPLSLADMFERLESGKAMCSIIEYALGETQIEVIFNRLCAQGQGGDQSMAS